MRQTRIVRNIWLGIENLLLHKLRSFLTMLGVVFGVGSVVAMLSVGEGASKEALDQIRKLGSNNIIITSIKSAEEEQASTSHAHMSIYGLTVRGPPAAGRQFRQHPAGRAGQADAQGVPAARAGDGAARGRGDARVVRPGAAASSSPAGSSCRPTRSSGRPWPC